MLWARQFEILFFVGTFRVYVSIMPVLVLPLCVVTITMFLDRSSPEVRTYETGDMILYTNLESTSYWQDYLDGLKFNGAAVIPTPCNCCFVEFVDTILSTHEHTVDCSATHKAVYSVGRTVYERPRGILPSPI